MAGEFLHFLSYLYEPNILTSAPYKPSLQLLNQTLFLSSGPALGILGPVHCYGPPSKSCSVDRRPHRPLGPMHSD